MQRAGSFCTSVLRTRDVKRAASFYNGLMGWKVEVAPRASGHWFFKFNRKIVASLQQVAGGMDAWVPHVLVDNLDTSTRLAQTLGATLIDTTHLTNVASLSVLQDSEGAVFGLWQSNPLQGAELTEEIGSLWWIEVLSNNVPTCRAFYTRLFGWDSRETSFEPFPSYTVFTRGREQEGGILPIGDGWDVSPTWNSIFSVDDGDKAVERAKALGGREIFTHTVPTAGRIGSIADPGGARFVIRGPVPV